VEHLETMFEDDDRVAVACIYCNYKEQAEQTVANLVASLLKQLIQGSHANFDKVHSLYARHRKRNSRPSLEELSRALESEIRTYSKVFVVVDALDECREDDETRAKLQNLLQSLPSNVNLMVTSRFLPLMAGNVPGAEILLIRATDEDVKTYIESRIALAPRHIKNLRETIVSKLIENFDGM
jgi:ATP/maltotriose-dependent transcriptional regulator MalT